MKLNHSWYVYAAFALGSQLMLSPSYGDVLIPSWPVLETSLEAIKDVPMTFDGMMQSPLFKQIMSKNDEDLMREMVGANQYPLVQLAGFLAIEQNYENDALREGLKLLLDPRNTSEDLLAPEWNIVSDKTNSHQVALIVGPMLDGPCINEGNWIVVATLLSHDTVQPLLDELEKRNALIEYRAPLLDILWSDALSKKSAPSEDMKKELNKCALVPGHARRVYLFYATETDGAYRDTMIAALQDPNEDIVRQLGLIIYEKAKYIKNSIDMSKLDISAERRKKLEEAMSVMLNEPGQATTRPVP